MISSKPLTSMKTRTPVRSWMLSSRCPAMPPRQAVIFPYALALLNQLCVLLSFVCSHLSKSLVALFCRIVDLGTQVGGQTRKLIEENRMEILVHIRLSRQLIVFFVMSQCRRSSFLKRSSTQESMSSTPSNMGTMAEQINRVLEMAAAILVVLTQEEQLLISKALAWR